jgi:biopolymer transport protein ExbD
MAMAAHDVTDTNVMGDINVTPMVDVMLVLLIIFMVVTPAIAAGFTAKLPVGAHLKSHEFKEDERTVVGIDMTGAYYVNKKLVQGCTGPQRATPVGKANCDQILLGKLQESYARHPQDHVLFLRADQSLPYQNILDAMALAKKSGVAMVAAVSEQPPGARPDLLEKAEN